MTTLTMRMIKGNFVVTGPDVEPMKFRSRRKARDWCAQQHPGSPIEEIGRKRAAKPPPKRPPVKREAEEDWGSRGRKVTEETPEQADLVDEYAPLVRPLGNLVILFAQAEAEWLKLVAEVSGCTEKEAQQLLKQVDKASARQKIINDLAQTTGIEGFDLRELSEGIESYYYDRERRNQLMHGEWYVSLLLAPGVPRTRRLSPKKDTAVTWGASTPDDVWRLAWRFLAYKRLFSYHRHDIQRKGSCASKSDVLSDD